MNRDNYEAATESDQYVVLASLAVADELRRIGDLLSLVVIGVHANKHDDPRFIRVIEDAREKAGEL